MKKLNRKTALVLCSLLAAPALVMAVKPCVMTEQLYNTDGSYSVYSTEWTTNSGGCCSASAGSAIVVEKSYGMYGQYLGSHSFYISISQAQAALGC